jgi:hypothetical protein
MKCQSCDKAATHHVTEIVGGRAAEYHVCEAHLKDLEGATLPPVEPRGPISGCAAFLCDSELHQALRDPTARQKVAAHLLPALCLALLDDNPEVKVAATFHLMRLGSDAGSASAALRDALQDADERVRKAAAIALEFFQTEQDWSWFF